MEGSAYGGADRLISFHAKGQAAADEVTSFLVKRGFSLVDYYEIFRQEQAIAWCTALFRLT